MAWGRRIGLAAALGCAVLAVPSGAGAAVREAETVMAPGQSGFVSIAGVLSGTGSPHLTDQSDLYANFGFKPANFGLEGTTETPRAGVRITRDAWGVPEVDADSDELAWWGAGYAVAQDRLAQMELIKRATSGRLSEILGASMLDDDIVARRDYYTEAEIDEMIERVFVGDFRRLSEAYVAGVNGWIAEVRRDLGKRPGEFVALGIPLVDWTIRDSARVGVFLARTVPSGDGAELDNLRALRSIGARNFVKLLPLRTAGRRPSVPRGRTARERRRNLFPSQPGRTRRHEVEAFRRSRRELAGLELPPANPPSVTDRLIERSPSAEDVPQSEGGVSDRSARSRPGRQFLPTPFGRRGSFMWAVGDREQGRSWLFNGPQLGWSIPELFVEYAVRYPGFNLRLSTAPGIPLVGIGFNDNVAWGFTSGLSDEDDLYIEELTGSETYRFRGEERRMDCRDEVFRYQAPITDLLGDPTALIGGSGTHTERICRTVHGPVQQRTEKNAFARRYAIWGRELETIVGLEALTRARTIHEVDRAMNQVTWNENLMAVDDRGNIGYWHPGLHPLKPRRYDERLPYPGTGEAEWRGLLPRSRTPRSINPRQGWLANWNNIPSWGWTNGDLPARERGAGEWHRVRWVEALARRLARNPSHVRSREMVRSVGSVAQQRPFAGRKLRQARRVARGRAREVLDTLLAWDGDYTRTDGSGTVDPGVAIWVDFKDQLEARFLAPMGRGANWLAGEKSTTHQFDVSNGEATAMRRLGARDWAAAAARTAEAMTERFGTPDVSRWREVRRTYRVEAMGAGSAPHLPVFDRGTWELAIELARSSE